MLFKNTVRQIRHSMGRYLAIFAIIFLGVGFFAGLKVTKEAMVCTGGDYFEELKLYDFRLVSTLGLTGEDVAEISELDCVGFAEGSVSADLLVVSEEGSDSIMLAHQLLDGINNVELVEGRLPEKADECIVDSKFMKGSVGEKLVLSKNNSDDIRGQFAFDSYTIVGVADSPCYINFERGNNSLGKISGFVYMPEEAFNLNCYTEIFLRLRERYEVYSEEYDKYVQDCQTEIEKVLENRAQIRYQSLHGYAKNPSVFCLGRSTNIGYNSLQNDTDIVSGISKVFPLFFFVVASLVCVTTMTRMVDEQRVQNGVLKALGYSNGAIIGQYLIYAGSASVLGCVSGFLVGSRYMPMVLWEIYHIMYSIDRPVRFILDWKLFGICVCTYLVAALGTTCFAVSSDLKEAAAELIRPKAPAAGKRVLLERIDFIWKRIKFLHKVSIRNIFRYKKRMFMMILGVGGCTALLLTGFGIRDSIQPIVNYQYDEIHVYDVAVSFLKNLTEEQQQSFCDENMSVTESVAFCHTESMDVMLEGSSDSVTLVAADYLGPQFVNLHRDDELYAYPGKDEVIIDYRLAMDNDISIGDVLELRNSDYEVLKLKVVGIFDNYIYDYAYISLETYRSQITSAADGEASEISNERKAKDSLINCAYVNIKPGRDVHDASSDFLSDENCAAVSVTEDMVSMVGNMLSSLDYVVLIVLVCAGALAFIVIYNLTNISINERIREIATIKVLGFYEGESAAYVFRENLVLTLISAVFGLPMGIALHRYVMAQIRINSMYFGHRILTASFVWAFVMTFVFALIVDFVMFFRLKKVNMAESLKAIE